MSAIDLENRGFGQYHMSCTRSSTCPLTGFFWLLSHVIYLKLTIVQEYYMSVFFSKLSDEQKNLELHQKD